MPTPKKKFKSQTRSSKTKATHPDPPAAAKPHAITAKRGLGDRPMNFQRKEKPAPKDSWWCAGAPADKRELFIVLAHQRNEEMLAAADHSWAKIERLHHIGEI